MSRAPCIEYKTTFVRTELEKVKIRQNYDNGTYLEKQLPVFSGAHSIEALLYCEERFRHYATRSFEWDTGPELFDNFEEILVDNALEKWETICAPLDEDERTVARFDQAIQELYLGYVDNNAKDIMIDYLKELRRPIKVTPRDHSNRMETLVRYTNLLPGTEPNVTVQQTKNMIFKTFPETWQQNWIRSGKNLVTDSLATLVQYMSNEKNFADKRDVDKKGKGKNDTTSSETPNKGNGNGQKSGKGGRGRGRNRGRGRGGNGYDRDGKRQKTMGPEDTCTIHGDHKWKNCRQNPRGERYDPRPTQGAGGGNYRGGGGRQQNNNNRAGRGGNQTNQNRQTGQGGQYDANEQPQQGTRNNNNNGGPAVEQHHFDMIGPSQGQQRQERNSGAQRMPGWQGAISSVSIIKF
jgi:hypothetical protein